MRDITLGKQPPTKSECLFLEYSRVRGYVANRISAPTGRFADFELIIGKDRVIAEVKELCANPEDKKMASAIQEGRIESFGDEPGRRIRTHIENAEGQLRRYEGQQVPCLVILYDNVIVDGFRPNPPGGFLVDPSNPLYPYHVDVGMYGLEAVKLRIHQDGRSETLGVSRGGKRTFRHGHHDCISAVATLHDYDPEYGLFLIVYHNFFAKPPLPITVFTHPNDRQFEKPRHPEFCPGSLEPIQVLGEVKK